MSHKIVRGIARPDAAVVKVLGNCGVATVHEAQGRTGLLRPYMRPIYPTAKLAGPAVTISIAPGDNLMIHASIEVCKPGDVLVVAPTSECTDGYFGELLGVSCQAHGIAGLIIDAGVRDTAELTELKFPVWSKAVSSQGTVKNVPGDVNIPVVCAGALINPGDVVIADADGVVVVPREAAAEVAKASEARIAKEEKTRERLRKGELGLDFYGLRAKLGELGVEFVDEAESKSIGSSK
ncbi:MAG TPA: 4-carboxy-4-hydroxy-2-oxoadipate aldolase/oxaloacetate decarboxylase [Bryobacteraceae bacterium]|jgi:4-hydroxy-4-methyl-2-oxoglutarate aldolase|nr:4-carboxy-4-hydroxy-2-oxoadipate aldolase/oxaloacetate decarboxylase [Bryobacteraceae bacterium]